MKAILKTLFLLFVTAVCLTSDTATSSVPQASPAPHSHIISAAGLSRPELISVLLLARKQWPSAKILGISEIGFGTLNFEPGTRGVIRPSDAMNVLRRELSDLP